jgi:hypothetical protein
VHVDAVGAPVELGGAQPDELPQLRVELDPVQFLGRRAVQVGQRSSEVGRVGVEVEPWFLLSS